MMCTRWQGEMVTGRRQKGKQEAQEMSMGHFFCYLFTFFSSNSSPHSNAQKGQTMVNHHLALCILFICNNVIITLSLFYVEYNLLIQKAFGLSHMSLSNSDSTANPLPTTCLVNIFLRTRGYQKILVLRTRT